MIGVTWGAATEEELRAESPIAIARTPAELAEVLYGREG